MQKLNKYIKPKKIILSKNIDKPKSKYLVFTSAGDNSNLHTWLDKHRNFDLWISYYGNEVNRYREICEYYIVKKGGKFPALYYVYKHWKNIFDQYKAIFVMDDDIIIKASAINNLFEIREKYDLWLLQPAFHPIGKISHPITKVHSTTFMRYTNFVEVTCPLFRKDKLDVFMEVYDPILVGWGIDWWFMEVLSPSIKEHIAIIDNIQCINPHDKTKGGQREIDSLQNQTLRIKNWEKIKKQYSIKSEEKGFIEFNSIKNSLSMYLYRKLILEIEKILYYIKNFFKVGLKLKWK